mgnify:FL=1
MIIFDYNHFNGITYFYSIDKIQVKHARENFQVHTAKLTFS